MKNLIAAAAVAGALLCAEEAPRSVWDGIYTEEQAKRGQPVYQRECGSCHGDQLTGGEMSPPLSGGEFLSNWNGLSVGELFERVRNTMPLNKPKSLSKKVNADILAFLLSANKFPAGKQELSQDAELLKQVRIEAEKPEAAK